VPVRILPKPSNDQRRRKIRNHQQKQQGTFSVATEKAQNVQDVFLNHLRKNKTPVTVFLVNGVKLQGIITWFDNFSVLLRRDGHTQLVYKHAISTVMPGAPIQLFDGVKTEAPVRETVAAGDG
jgi:host factor-I protein